MSPNAKKLDMADLLDAASRWFLVDGNDIEVEDVDCGHGLRTVRVIDMKTGVAGACRPEK